MKKSLVAILLIFAVSSVFANHCGYAYGDITAYTFNCYSYEVYCDEDSVADGLIDHSASPNASYVSEYIYTGTYDFVCVFYNQQNEVIARDLVEDVFVPGFLQGVKVDFYQ